MRFAGQTAVVTGAGMGIGYAVVRALAREGARVVLNDVDRARADEAARAISAEVPAAPPVVPRACDVADVAAVRAMIGEAAASGRLDVVVANAGVTVFRPFLEDTPEAFDALMGINLRGSYFTAQAAAHAMIAAGSGAGRIILMSSVNGFRAFPGLAAYAATKAALVAMARNLAVELGPHRITVNAVAPGATLTERTRQEQPHYDEEWAAVTPTGRAATVDDITQAVLFLASADAGHVTGQTLIVDGGWTSLGAVPGGYRGPR
jgi:glucose 1-dehydrogenase